VRSWIAATLLRSDGVTTAAAKTSGVRSWIAASSSR
jgi:hypothetical protein